MIRVYLESPYAGDTERNLRYLRACIRDSIEHGEAPFASHGLYTQALEDKNPDERAQGIMLGDMFRRCCRRTVVYTDLGISPGMMKGIEAASKLGSVWVGTEPVEPHLIQFRSLGPEWDKKAGAV